MDIGVVGGRATFRILVVEGLAYLLALPGRVERLAFLDIIPTRSVFERVDKALATSTYHWFFLIQPELPEALIGANPDFYLDWTLKKWSRDFA